MNRTQWVSRALVSVCLLLSSLAATLSQPYERCERFPETGHDVCDEFLRFYEQRGGVEIFGYPLTEAFNDPQQEMRVQYFQRARMEWHPDAPAPYKVQLGLLVDELGYRFPPASPDQIPSRNTPTHHYFPETNHTVSYSFLDYFRSKGGLDIFGYPRSEFIYENGVVVQYFQRARMEWHPEIVGGSQIRLSNLGEVYLRRFDHIIPDPPPGGPDSDLTLLALRSSASVRHVITARSGRQTIFVYVNDQDDQPVRGVDVRIVVHYQVGDQHYSLPATDESGFTRHDFDILLSPPGQRVIIDVVATHGGLTGATQTFFIPWW